MTPTICNKEGFVLAYFHREQQLLKLLKRGLLEAFYEKSISGAI